MRKFLLAIVFVLLLAGQVWGADHYVNCAGSGSTGTFGDPFSTIDQVNGHAMAAGDDVYFLHNTTCSDSGNGLNIDWSGVDANNKATIGCYDGDGDFDCTGKTLPIINVSQPYDCIGVDGQDYVEIKDLQLRNCRDGVEIGSIASSYIYIHGCTIGVGIENYGIRCLGVADSCNNSEFYNNVISSDQTDAKDGVAVVGSDNVKVYRNDIFNWAHNGVNVETLEKAAISGNEVYENYIIGSSCSNDDPCRCFALSGDNTYQASGNKIYYNYCYNFNQKSKLDRNTVSNEIYYNIFDTLRSCGACGGDTLIDEASLQINLLANSATDITNNEIYGNTFYDCTESCLRFDNNAGSTGSIGGTGDENLFANNTFHTFGTYAIEISNDGNGVDEQIFYNNYGYDSSVTNEVYDRTSAKNLEGWSNAIDTTANNNDSDCDFTDAANGDFTLKSTSPCKNAGWDPTGTQSTDMIHPDENSRDNFGQGQSISTIDEDGFMEVGAYGYVPAAETADKVGFSGSKVGGP